MTPEEYARRKAIARTRAWKEANPERWHDYHRDYYYRNREEILAKRRAKRRKAKEET